MTTRYISDGPECETIMEFGKFKGKPLSEVDSGWLAWAVNEFTGDKKHMFHSEIVRRQLFVSKESAGA